MEKFFSKLIALAVLLIMAPGAAVFAANDDGDPVEEEQTLQELLDSFKFGVDDYAYGTAPGYVGDQAVYEEFYNIYSDAIQLAGSTTATDEEKAAMCTKLKDAKAKVEAAINPVTDGTYYIVTAYSVFAEKDTMAWFAPREGNYPGWKKKAPNVTFMWNVKKLENGNYSIQSLSTGQYVNHNDVIDGQETNMYMTDALETEQMFDNISPNGQFNIHCVGATWTYNIQKHNAGNGINGPIGNWTDKNVNGEGAWRLVPVSDADLAAAEATRNHDLLDVYVNAFVPGDYTFGTDPGQYSKTAFDAVKTEVEASKNMLADTENAPTEEACKTALDKYTAAKAALDASLVQVTDGYYTISNNTYSSVVKGNTCQAWSAKNSYLYGFNWEVDNPAFVWKITKLANGNYSVQSHKTGEFINSTDLFQQGASINLTKAHNTDIVIKRKKGERFSIADATSVSKGFGYATGIDLVWIITSASSSDLFLHKLTEEEVASMAVAYAQRLRTDSLRNLIIETSVRANSDSVYTIDMESPVATDASQLFITNQSTESPDLNNLIDKNFDTFCTSAWNESTVGGTDEPDKFHAIRVDAGEGKTLPRNVGFHWRSRGSSWIAMYRPTDVKFYASNDAENWDYIGERKNPEAGFTTTAEEPEYTSTEPVILNKPYRYINMEVIKTNTNDLGKYSKPFFQFSEFNAYPMNAEFNEKLSDPEVLQAVKDLREAIAKAQGKVDNNNATSNDIADLRTAYNNLLLVWKDTTDICNIYNKAKAFSSKVAVGEDPFCFPSDKVSDFEDALVEVDNAYPFESINQREVARLDTLLTRAYNALVNSMVGPDPNTWYFVTCADETVEFQGAPVKGKFAYMGGYSASDGMGCVGLEGIIKDLRRVWKFEATGTPNVYNMICVANGWPINRGPVRLEAIGEGQFAIYTNADLNSAYYINPAVLVGVPAMAGKEPVANGWGAWAMEEISPEMTRRITLKKDKVFAMVNPFDTEALPTAYTEGHEVMTYSVCGYEVGDDGKTITAINLTEFVPDEELGGIPAGTPFVMVVDGDQEYDAETAVVIDLHPAHGGNVTHEAKMVNGLGGQFASWPYPKDMLYFESNVAKVRLANHWTLDPLDAYLDQSQIVNDPNASIDKVIPVDSQNGTVEIPNGIASLVNSSKAVVDVYTTDGVLVRKNVKIAEATKGLKKGVYIVGKNKVLVK